MPEQAASHTGLPDSPFELADDDAYQRWRRWKLQARPRDAADVLVDVADPRALKPHERDALRERIARCSFALYRSAQFDADPALPVLLGAQLGLRRLDANWLADEDGISHIEVGGARGDNSGGGGGYIPYTDRAIQWHTDGYYHGEDRRIDGMILHCVRDADTGGANRLLDHELAYIALRDASPAWVEALMHPRALVIPQRSDAGQVVRAAQPGPVFSVGAHGRLHMRYTARTRSIEWRDEPATREAVSRLAHLLEGGIAGLIEVRLEPGMGIVGHNVLHARAAFRDDVTRPRLLYRARFLDRILAPGEEIWP